MTIDQDATLTGSDSFVVNGLLTLDAGSTLGPIGTVDAYGGLSINTESYHHRHRWHDAEQPRRRHLDRPPMVST